MVEGDEAVSDEGTVIDEDDIDDEPSGKEVVDDDSEAAPDEFIEGGLARSSVDGEDVADEACGCACADGLTTCKFC